MIRRLNHSTPSPQGTSASLPRPASGPQARERSLRAPTGIGAHTRTPALNLQLYSPSEAASEMPPLPKLPATKLHSDIRTFLRSHIWNPFPSRVSTPTCPDQRRGRRRGRNRGKISKINPSLSSSLPLLKIKNLTSKITPAPLSVLCVLGVSKKFRASATLA